MANNIEWVHTSQEPEVISPDLVEELADDGNEDRDWAVGADGIMIYGQPLALRAWLMSALADLQEPARKQTNARIKRRLKDAGKPKCEHEWQLTEDGYCRTWVTYVDTNSKTITAQYRGPEDFSESGTGEYLQCTQCGHTKPVPTKYEVDFQ